MAAAAKIPMGASEAFLGVERSLTGRRWRTRDADLALVEAFRTLLPAITTLVAHHFRRVLLEVAQEHLESVGEATELAAVSAESSRSFE